jgi:hypothetical protein
MNLRSPKRSPQRVGLSTTRRMTPRSPRRADWPDVAGAWSGGGVDVRCEREAHAARVTLRAVDSFAGSLLSRKVEHYDADKWIEWACTYKLDDEFMSRILTSSDRMYLGLAAERFRNCAKELGRVAYAQFVVTTMLHRFTTVIPTCSGAVDIPRILRGILVMYDEYSKKPLVGG